MAETKAGRYNGPMSSDTSSSRIQIYMDGSAKTRPGPGKKCDLSWGIVALFKDEHVELKGARLDLPRRFCGSHEDLALIEAVRFARSHGYSFESMSFVTDDSAACQAGGYLHPDNFRPHQAQELRARYKEMCDAFYDEATFEEVIECLSASRFTKVKGHAGVIYNMRVDYLARVARDPSQAPIEYDDWLNEGFAVQATPLNADDADLTEFSGEPGEGDIAPDTAQVVWRPPFTDPSLAPARQLREMSKLALREASRAQRAMEMAVELSEFPQEQKSAGKLLSRAF